MSGITPKPVLIVALNSSGQPNGLITVGNVFDIPLTFGGVLETAALQFGFNPNSDVWQKIYVTETDVDGLATQSSNVQSTLAQLAGLNNATGLWDRIRAYSSASDGNPTVAAGNLQTLAQLYGLNSGGTFDRVRSGSSSADGLATSIGNLQTISESYAYNGATFDRVRIADVFKTVVATAGGNTAVWTPTSGKKFRLMGYTLSISGTMTATGTNVLQLTDGLSVTIAQHAATVTATTPTGDTQIGCDFGQGYLSIAANNVLEVHLGTAMATGGVYVNAWGTEE